MLRTIEAMGPNALGTAARDRSRYRRRLASCHLGLAVAAAERQRRREAVSHLAASARLGLLNGAWLKGLVKTVPPRAVLGVGRALRNGAGDRRSFRSRARGRATCEGRSGSFRSFLRRACRRAAEAGVLFEAVVEGSRAGRGSGGGLRLEASGWKGEGRHAILNRSAVAEFYRRLVSDPDGANGVRQYLLRMDGRLVAWDLCVVHERVCHALKTAYDESEAALSPGFVLQALELETLFRQRKLRAYDLLPPESAFKSRWTDESLEQIHVRLYTRTPRARLAKLVHARLRPALRRIRSLQALKTLISSE